MRSSERGRIVVVDEDEGSRTFLCAALDSGGYEVVPVATTIGLRKVLVPERPAVVLCEVSPPRTYHQAVATIGAVRAVAEGRAPVVLCGSQSVDQLEILARAGGVSAFVERRADPLVLLRGIRRVLAISRRAVTEEQLQAIGSTRSHPQWGIIKVLLVDDSEIVLEIMQARLRESGFDVRIALALGEVQSIIQGWSPNVIVADVDMPEIRGDDLCTRIKMAAATRDAMVVLCSSLSDAELGQLTASSGADGFVSKSNGLDQCASYVESMCRRLSNPVVSFE